MVVTEKYKKCYSLNLWQLVHLHKWTTKLKIKIKTNLCLYEQLLSYIQGSIITISIIKGKIKNLFYHITALMKIQLKHNKIH